MSAARHSFEAAFGSLPKLAWNVTVQPGCTSCGAMGVLASKEHGGVVAVCEKFGTKLAESADDHKAIMKAVLLQAASNY
jgi:hypothetical protein